MSTGLSGVGLAGLSHYELVALSARSVCRVLPAYEPEQGLELHQAQSEHEALFMCVAATSLWCTGEAQNAEAMEEAAEGARRATDRASAGGRAAISVRHAASHTAYLLIEVPNNHIQCSENVFPQTSVAANGAAGKQAESACTAAMQMDRAWLINNRRQGERYVSEDFFRRRIWLDAVPIPSVWLGCYGRWSEGLRDLQLGHIVDHYQVQAEGRKIDWSGLERSVSRWASGGGDDSPVFLFKDKVWTLSFLGTTAFLPDPGSLAGLRYIAYLLERPGEPVAAARLYRPGEPDEGTETSGFADDVDDDLDVKSVGDYRGLDDEDREAWEGDENSGSGQDVKLDGPGITQYRKLKRELTIDLKASTDPVERKRIGHHLQLVNKELSDAVAPGGRPRLFVEKGDDRLRQNVTKAITSARGKIRQVHPQLADHLKRYIKTGMQCQYNPPSKTEWSVLLP